MANRHGYISASTVISACGFHRCTNLRMAGPKSSGAKATVTPFKPQAPAMTKAVCVLVVTKTCKPRRAAKRSSTTQRAEANSPFDAACSHRVSPDAGRGTKPKRAPRAERGSWPKIHRHRAMASIMKGTKGNKSRAIRRIYAKLTAAAGVGWANRSRCAMPAPRQVSHHRLLRVRQVAFPSASRLLQSPPALTAWANR